MTGEPWFVTSGERLRRASEDAARLYDIRMHDGDGPTIAHDNRIDGILTLDLPDAVRAHDRLVRALDFAAAFLTAYDAASASDEEGLLMAVDPDEMRQLWHRVDEAAGDLRQMLATGYVPGRSPRTEAV